MNAQSDHPSLPSIVHTADFHFGHMKVSTLSTIDSIANYAFEYIEKCDVLVISGDVFDMSISLNSSDAVLAIEFFMALFKLLDEKNITCRVLRGTISHDRNQLAILNTLYSNGGFTFDFKYVDTLSFEYIEKWNKRIVYIPDNLFFKSSDEVIAYIRSQMNLLGWEYVDWAVLHGDFIYNYPDNVAIHGVTYKEDQFDFVKEFVFAGHNHVWSKKGKILFPGSFNRLRHGEEGKKGFFFIKGNKIKFIENPDAVLFKTFNTPNINNSEQIIKLLSNYLSKYFDKDKRAFIRINNCKHEIKQAVRDFIYANYPKIIVSFKKSKISTSDKVTALDALKANNRLEPPTPHNIHILVFGNIQDSGLIISKNEIAVLLKAANPK